MGIRAVLFEAGLIGDGASGRTGGLVLEGTAAGILDQVDACVPGLRRLVDEAEIDCDLVLPGCWEIEHRKLAPARMLPASKAASLIARALARGTKTFAFPTRYWPVALLLPWIPDALIRLAIRRKMED